MAAAAQLRRPVGPLQIGEKVDLVAGPAADSRGGPCRAVARRPARWPADRPRCASSSRLSISSRTAAASKAGVPTTTRGGAAIKTSVKASPCGLSSTICAASSLARVEAALVGRPIGHRIGAVDHQHAMRPPAGGRRPGRSRSRYGSATASTTSTITSSVRTASSSHCSSSSRRRLLPHGRQQIFHGRPGHLADTSAGSTGGSASAPPPPPASRASADWRFRRLEAAKAWGRIGS